MLDIGRHTQAGVRIPVVFILYTFFVEIGRIGAIYGNTSPTSNPSPNCNRMSEHFCVTLQSRDISLIPQAVRKAWRLYRKAPDAIPTKGSYVSGNPDTDGIRDLTPFPCMDSKVEGC